jgi:hypothetical protein
MKRTCFVVAVLIAVSCEGDKPSPVLGPGPVTPILSTVLIQGAPAIGPGESARVQATARYSDGSEKDVTAEATWTSTQTRIATVAAGVITGQALGRVTIQARFESRTATVRLVIQPAGTFILTGNITEPGPINVGSATVAIVGGSNQVTSTVSGFYELFGVSGTVGVRVSKPGYFDETRALTVMENQRLDVQIRPVLAPTSIAGNYRVTLTISSACASVPAEHKTRTYTAAIEQNSALVRVELRDANFAVDSRSGAKNRFNGKVMGNTVTFEWGTGSNYYYYYDDLAIQEILSSTQTLGIWGRVEAPVAQTISGNLVGGFYFREGNRTSRCSDSNSTVVFTRN